MHKRFGGINPFMTPALGYALVVHPTGEANVQSGAEMKPAQDFDNLCSPKMYIR